MAIPFESPIFEGGARSAPQRTAMHEGSAPSGIASFVISKGGKSDIGTDRSFVVRLLSPRCRVRDTDGKLWDNPLRGVFRKCLNCWMPLETGVGLRGLRLYTT